MSNDDDRDAFTLTVSKNDLYEIFFYTLAFFDTIKVNSFDLYHQEGHGKEICDY